MNPEGRVIWSGIDSTRILAQVRITLPSDPGIPCGKVESRVFGDVIKAAVRCRPEQDPGDGGSPHRPEA